MSFAKRKKAILECGSHRDLVIIFNSDLKAHYLKVGKGIPPPIFRCIVELRDVILIQKRYPQYTFYQITCYFELIRERNLGEIPPFFIEL